MLWFVNGRISAIMDTYRPFIGHAAVSGSAPENKGRKEDTGIKGAPKGQNDVERKQNA